MHIHILGICGTFMGGLAALALKLGHEVTGSDVHVYPPMSEQLKALGIGLYEGYDPERLNEIKPDLVIVGNALSRGNPVIEKLITDRYPMVSGPQWLHEHVLLHRWVLGVAGTHGKTSTSTMLAWLLEKAGLTPGFLIGGVPNHYEFSARLGEGPFIVEADEYDTAFFDKRSKFVHYWPKTCIVNNLEFDHADIFKNLEDIQKQFHHLIRLVPSDGRIIVPTQCQAIDEVLAMGCWSPTVTVGEHGHWSAQWLKEDGSQFIVYQGQEPVGEVNWGLIGAHNIQNALSALAGAEHLGLEPELLVESLNDFKLPKRRLELKGTYQGITLYDDFAHHPTAIETTLQGLRAKVQNMRIGVVLDLRSNTMKMGVHQERLRESCQLADFVLVYQAPNISWPVKEIMEKSDKIKVFNSTNAIIDRFHQQAKSGDHWVVMSNGGFDGMINQLANTLQKVPNVTT